MRLEIHRVQAEDFTSYKCVAKNSLGETDGKIRLFGKIELCHEQKRWFLSIILVLTILASQTPILIEKLDSTSILYNRGWDGVKSNKASASGFVQVSTFYKYLMSTWVALSKTPLTVIDIGWYHAMRCQHAGASGDGFDMHWSLSGAVFAI